MSLNRRQALIGGVGIAAAIGGAGVAWRRQPPLGPATPEIAADDPAVLALWALRPQRPDGGELVLASLRGKPLVVNFWATWCPPCREEMPALDRLQAAMPEIAVVPVATGRNDPETITRFFTEAQIANLENLRDPTSDLAHAMGIMGLPVTVIVNPEGQEVARLIGDAHWDGPEAQAVLKALMAGQ